jgi:hypothetical protein
MFGTYQGNFKSKKSIKNKTDGVMENDTTTQQLSSISTSTPRLDPKASLEQWWWPEHPVYVFGGILLIGLWCIHYFWLRGTTTYKYASPLMDATIVTVGPIVWAFVLTIWTNKGLPWRKVLLSPFDKDPLWNIALHFGLGVILGVLPATYFVYLVLSSPPPAT